MQKANWLAVWHRVVSACRSLRGFLLSPLWLYNQRLMMIFMGLVPPELIRFDFDDFLHSYIPLTLLFHLENPLFREVRNRTNKK